MAHTIINGSVMEGGGQILRMAMDFSALLRKPIQIIKIRANRSKPGLKAQHLSGMNLVRDICGGSLQGAELHANQIIYYPASCPRGGHYTADTKTAGAVTLLAQISLPCLIFSNEEWEMDLKGGTNADMAPQIDYYTQVFIPNLRRFGPNIECVLKKKGYFPKGGGHIKLKMRKNANSQGFKNVELLNSGHIEKISIHSSVAGSLPVKIANEMAHAAKQTLESHLKCHSITETISYKESGAFGNGSSIFIKAITSTGCILGGSSVGSSKTSPQKTGENAASDLLNSLKSGACVDQWMQDQMIIYMALAKGISRIRTGPLTMHTKTAIYISELLSDCKFNVVQHKDENHSNFFIIECKGIGL